MWSGRLVLNRVCRGRILYKKVLLAYDGFSRRTTGITGGREARAILRRSSLPASRCRTFLRRDLGGRCRDPDGRTDRNLQAILAEGVERLKAMGFSPTARLGRGAAGQEIAGVAEEIGATSSSWVSVTPGRWRDGGSALSGST